MKQLCGCLTIKLPPTPAACDLVAVELTFEEAIRLTSEPIAVFDHNAVLSLANVAFRDAARPVVSFLAPGTPWPVLLALVTVSPGAALAATLQDGLGL